MLVRSAVIVSQMQRLQPLAGFFNKFNLILVFRQIQMTGIQANADLIAVQPIRGLDVGAIEYIHKQIVAQRDAGKGVLLVSLELDEVMTVSDRILVMYEGEIVGELDPKKTTVEELGLYMAGAKKEGK